MAVWAGSHGTPTSMAAAVADAEMAAAMEIAAAAADATDR